MTVGNWRDHILVDCASCSKPMGWHVETVTAVCNECDRQLKNAVFIGNTKAAVIAERLRGLKTLRVGTQAVDINGEALDPREYLPLYIDKSEEKAYDDIMRNALKKIRRD